MRHKAGLVTLSAALCGTALALASCGHPVPFTQLALPSIPALSRPAPPPPVRAPYAVAANNGAALKPDTWTNSTQLELAAELPSDADNRAVLEAEFAPADQPLVGLPNAWGKPGESVLKSPGMTPGQRYHWALRLRAPRGGASSWLQFPGSIGYQPTPPAAPAVQPLPHDGWVGD